MAKKNNGGEMLTRNIEGTSGASMQTSSHPRVRPNTRRLEGKSIDFLNKSSPTKRHTLKERIPEQTETSSQFDPRSKLINSCSLEKLVNGDEEEPSHLQIFSDSEAYQPPSKRKLNKQLLKKSSEELGPIA